MAEPAFTEELVESNRTAFPSVVIVEDDEATIHDLVIQVVQAAAHAGVPIAVDSENRDRSDTLAVHGQRLVEPALDKFRIRKQAEIPRTLLHFFERCRAVFEVPIAVG